MSQFYTFDNKNKEVKSDISGLHRKLKEYQSTVSQENDLNDINSGALGFSISEDNGVYTIEVPNHVVFKNGTKSNNVTDKVRFKYKIDDQGNATDVEIAIGENNFQKLEDIPNNDPRDTVTDDATDLGTRLTDRINAINKIKKAIEEGGFLNNDTFLVNKNNEAWPKIKIKNDRGHEYEITIDCTRPDDHRITFINDTHVGNADISLLNDCRDAIEGAVKKAQPAQDRELALKALDAKIIEIAQKNSNLFKTTDNDKYLVLSETLAIKIDPQNNNLLELRRRPRVDKNRNSITIEEIKEVSDGLDVLQKQSQQQSTNNTLLFAGIGTFASLAVGFLGAATKSPAATIGGIVGSVIATAFGFAEVGKLENKAVNAGEKGFFDNLWTGLKKLGKDLGIGKGSEVSL